MRIQVFRDGILITDSDLVGFLRELLETPWAEALILLVILCFPPTVPGMVMNFIDDVILWAQTSRGGRQQNMLRVLNDRPACESKYGLCE